ncbi:polynucleotide adenylyltransferase PcnB [Chiayiivirga flava]|uniref:Poly(A) polymerase I n=1 Tax=Chiayiivirga flava TaxID=659595 RepID=A0A7W8D2Z8_9GAMM|nr:poly(A) polymerase [Chiayiivirga flava]
MEQTSLAPRIDPRVIPRDQHTISRKQISPNALRVLYRLNEAGFGAYLVGGAVRDLLLGGAPKDFDVATDATPEQVKALFRNCRLIGRRFRLAHVVYGPEIIEVATFRANTDDGSGEREVDNGRLVRDNVYGTIEDDAVRRDFTANALYYTVSDFSVRDFVGGYEDVMARTLRLIGDPESRYREDPVRMLRAVRLAAKLDFSIDPAAAEPIARLAGLLGEASSARLFEETLKMFLAGHAANSFERLERHGLVEGLLPDTAAALAADGSGLCRAMLMTALRGSDARIADGRTVTPAFLFAALLWPAYAHDLQQLLDGGHELAIAEQRAADRVTLRQASRIAIPRRFSAPMHEIWWMQSRFGTRQRKRVMRLLAHPRFRAAFDFLELRASVVPELADELAWWREAQGLAPETLVEKLAGAPRTAGTGKPKRRRRRSGRKPAGAGTE